ncbi:MAG: WD40 repeat domain-containing protein [Chloroflexota bacterium]
MAAAGLLACGLAACGSAASPPSSPPAVGQSPSMARPTPGTVALKSIISQSVGQDTVETVSFSPRGNYLAVGAADGTVALYPLHPKDPADAGRSRKMHAGFVGSLEWAPSGGKLLTAATDGSVRIWSAQGFRVLKTFNAYPKTHPAAAWSPDGNQIALAEGKDTIEVLPASGGSQPMGSFNLPGTTRSLLWMPGGKELVGSDAKGNVDFFQRGTSTPVRVFHPGTPLGAVNSLSLSPTQPLLAVGYDSGTIVLLDPGTAKEVRTFPKGRSVNSLAWSPNGHILAETSLAFAVTLWDAQGHRLARENIGYDMNGVAWSPDCAY